MYAVVLYWTFNTLINSALSNDVIFVDVVNNDIRCGIDSGIKFYFKDNGRQPENGPQSIDLTLGLPTPLSDDDLAEVIVYTKRGKESRWTKLFTIPKKFGVCKSLDSYFGNVWYGIQIRSGVAPKTCPLVGLFKVHDYPFNSKDLRLPTLPKGIYNISAKIVNKKLNRAVACPEFVIKSL